MEASETPYYTKPALLDLEVVDSEKSFNSLINESSFRINLYPTQDLKDLFEEHNFTAHGISTWSRHIRNDTTEDIANFLNEYQYHYTQHTLFSSPSKAQSIELRDVMYKRYYQTSQLFFNNSSGSINGVTARVLNVIQDISENFYQHYNEFRRYTPYEGIRDIYSKYDYDIRIGEPTPHELRNELSPAHLFVYVKNNTLWVKIIASPVLSEPYYDHNNDQYLRFFVNDFNKSNKGKNFLPRYEAESIMYNINKYLFTSSAWDIEKSQPALDLLDKANKMITAGYAPGQPAKAYVTKGHKISQNLKGSTLKSLRNNEPENVSISKILKSEKDNETVDFAIHPSLVDIVNMNKAKKYNQDKRLHDYQKIATGLHLSTEIGYLNSSDPGLGKSVMQLTAMRERAKRIENYRGIIVCEANVRNQWKEYAETWFPEASVFILNSSAQSQGFIDALSEEKPVIVLSSYSLTTSAIDVKEEREKEMNAFENMDTQDFHEFFADKKESSISTGELFLDTHWHDICADEAVCIRNGSSKQARAMWLLRRNSDIAVALTGTPVNKNPDDIGKLLEWVRNDNRLFQKRKLSENYDTNTLKGATELFEDLSPLVFRRERNEVQDEIESGENALKLPTMIPPKTILLKPSVEEKSLAHAAEKELKRVYLELVSALEAVEDESGSTDEIKEAKEQLRNARGQWLGGTQLARMATSDPASLINSDSVGASLLVGQGLVANALENEPTKRKEFIKRAKEHIEKDQSILVFTDFAVVAESLVEALEENGIRAGMFTGKNLKSREQNRNDFQNGDLDVLVCTKAGERGLTLHKASAVYHYDIPWTIERLIQRMGRAIRVGAENDEVEIFFLILEGTVEERVATQVLSQGTSASMILDASRGIDVSKTGLGNTMSGLISTSKSLASTKGALEFGKALNLT